MGDAGEQSVVRRLAAILAAFDENPSLGLSDLARHVAMPKATVHRLAGQLVTHGLLERNDERYQLGGWLFELGQRVPRSRVLRDAALPFMEDLYVSCRETVHLAVPAGRNVLYIDKLVGHGSGRTPSKVAGRMAMHTTATGKAMMSHFPGSTVEAYLDQPLVRVTRHTIVVADVLRDELVAARQMGYAIEREETMIGYVSVAAPVFGPDDLPVAALSVTGPVVRFDPDRFGPAVRTAALSLGRTLTTNGNPTTTLGSGTLGTDTLGTGPRPSHGDGR